MSQLNVLHQLTKYKQYLIAPMLLTRSRMLFHTTQLAQQQRQQQQQGHSGSSTVQRSGDRANRTDVSTDVRPLGEKIKENTKTASYTAIIIAGIGVTGIMFYAIFRELFSSSSPNSIYSNALERVKEDYRVQDAIGAPIKGFGEESRRGRRQHVAHSSYERNGVPHMRMQFYVQGLRNKATVHLESRQSAAGKVEFRYLFVQLNHYPHTTIILEDNRAYDTENANTPTALQSSAVEFTSYQKK